MFESYHFIKRLPGPTKSYSLISGTYSCEISALAFAL
jgi:hypothetical protein